MIGKVIRSLLDDSAGLVALVPVASMYPYVMNENTALPAIVYTIDNLDVDYDKDGQVQDKYSFSVVSFSGDYASLQTITALVRAALELKRGTVEGTTIQPIYLRGMQEGYDLASNIFMNRLTFDVNVV
jgi:hypothetical protein